MGKTTYERVLCKVVGAVEPVVISKASIEKYLSKRSPSFGGNGYRRPLFIISYYVHRNRGIDALSVTSLTNCSIEKGIPSDARIPKIKPR